MERRARFSRIVNAQFITIDHLFAESTLALPQREHGVL
jgi:hypothetical protein